MATDINNPFLINAYDFTESLIQQTPANEDQLITKYINFIKNPSQMGMDSKGASLTTDFVGLVEYVKLLITGDSKASTTGGPLGNKFFLKTMGNCKATDTGSSVPRYLYFNNIPAGNIPIISSALGTDFKDFKGLVPGAIGDVAAFNPGNIYRSLTSGTNPDCQNVSLEVIDNNNKVTTETHYVAVSDLAAMDPCGFPKGVNPATGQKCKETFDNPGLGMELDLNNMMYYFTKDPLAFIFLVGYCLLIIYLCMGAYVRYSD